MQPSVCLILCLVLGLWIQSTLFIKCALKSEPRCLELPTDSQASPAQAPSFLHESLPDTLSFRDWDITPIQQHTSISIQPHIMNQHQRSLLPKNPLTLLPPLLSQPSPLSCSTQQLLRSNKRQLRLFLQPLWLPPFLNTRNLFFT